MNEDLQIAGAILIASVLLVGGFWFAYDIYESQQNCQKMDAQRHITANCWAFPSRFFVAGGGLLGLIGTAILITSARTLRNR